MRNLKRQVVNAQLEDFIAPVAGELLGLGVGIQVGAGIVGD